MNVGGDTRFETYCIRYSLWHKPTHRVRLQVWGIGPRRETNAAIHAPSQVDSPSAGQSCFFSGFTINK